MDNSPGWNGSAFRTLSRRRCVPVPWKPSRGSEIRSSLPPERYAAASSGTLRPRECVPARPPPSRRRQDSIHPRCPAGPRHTAAPRRKSFSCFSDSPQLCDPESLPRSRPLRSAAASRAGPASGNKAPRPSPHPQIPAAVGVSRSALRALPAWQTCRCTRRRSLRHPPRSWSWESPASSGFDRCSAALFELIDQRGPLPEFRRLNRCALPRGPGTNDDEIVLFHGSRREYTIVALLAALLSGSLLAASPAAFSRQPSPGYFPHRSVGRPAPFSFVRTSLDAAAALCHHSENSFVAAPG